MNRIIGYVCEGPRDVDLLSAIVDMLFPDDTNQVRQLQPENSGRSKNYTGWKGVLRWCAKDWKTVERGNKILVDHIDTIIIQMDADVSRKKESRQVHCGCGEWICEDRENLIQDGIIQAENCGRDTEDCPIPYPCPKHYTQHTESYVSHLEELIQLRKPQDTDLPYILTIPCDSADAWIVAANEHRTDTEQICDPWKTIITRKKSYAGIELSRNSKNKAQYASLIQTVLKNWEQVKQDCPQAALFEKQLKNLCHGCQGGGSVDN